MHENINQTKTVEEVEIADNNAKATVVTVPLVLRGPQITLHSIKGDTGEKGDKGDKGDTGPQGPSGGGGITNWSIGGLAPLFPGGTQISYDDGTELCDGEQLYGWTSAGSFVFMDNASSVSGTSCFHVGLQNQLTALGGGNTTFWGIGNTGTLDYSFVAGYNNQNNTQAGYGYNTVVGAECYVQNSDYSTAGGFYASVTNANNAGSIAWGINSQVNGDQSVLFGINAGVDGTRSVCVGPDSSVDGDYATAIGFECNVQADSATAIGYLATTDVEYTINIGGTNIVQAGGGYIGDDCVWAYSGCEAIIMTQEVDLTSAPSTYTINLPANCHFFVDECALIVSSGADLAVQPTVSFGDEVNSTDLLAPTLTTDLTAVFTRQRFTVLSNYDGHTVLSASVTVGATAPGGSFNGRFVFKGVLVRDQ